MLDFKSSLALIIGILQIWSLGAQSGCNINLDAGPDITICEGQSGNLNGSVTGNYDQYEWTPATGLGNPGDLNTSVTVSTPTIYTLTARGEGSNIIVNGGIENGSLAPSTTGFSFVTVNNLPLSAGGSYTIGTSVNFNNIWGCSVHSGTYAMAYHGTGAAGANIWCQTVSVQPNTDYKLEAWLMSVVIPFITTAPSISVQVNGATVASTTGSPTLNCSWSSANGTWNSGGATSATVCIINNNGSRNFGGIDDISMVECCEITDEVLVDVERVNAVIAPNGPITCDQPQLILDGTGSSSGPGFTYEWSTNDGLILSGFNTLMPTIGELGTYRLKVTSPNGCEKETEITIEGSVTPPDLRTIDATLSCEDSPAWVIATSSDPTVSFKWTGPNGFTSLDPSFTTTTGGVYYVRAEDAYNCFSIDSVVVIDTRSFPNISILGDTLSCGKDSIELKSQSDSWKLTYRWTAPDGMSSDKSTLTAGDTGVYILTVIDSNECAGADTFRVIEIDLDFEVYATTDTITCADPVARLRGISDSSNVEYKWTGPNGFSASGPEITVTDSGYYIMVATYDSLCSKTDTVRVIKEDDVPDISILGDTLDCTKDSVVLTGSSNSSGVSFSWTGPGGLVSSSPTISVDSTGIYTLQVIGDNGCVIMESFEVVRDTALPEFVVSGEQLSCDIDTVQLVINRLSPFSMIEWTIPGGATLSGPIVQAGQQGLYLIQVTGENGCISKDSFLLSSSDAAPRIEIEDDTISCIQSEVILDAWHPDVIEWVWSGPNGFSSMDSVISVSQGGIYILNAESVNGCDTMIRINITPDTSAPDLTIMADTIKCLQGQAQITLLTADTSGAAQWTGPNGFSSDLISPVAPSEGWYKVNYISSNGCSTTDSIFVNYLQDLPEIFSKSDTINCLKDSVILSAMSRTPNVRYEWQDAINNVLGTSAEVTIGQPGNYRVWVITPDGCRNDTVVQVTLDTTSPDILGIASQGLKCDSVFTTLDATIGPGVVDLEWSGPGTFFSREEDPRVSEIGWYYLTVFGANGCQKTDSIFLIAQDTKPDVMALADTLNCNTASAFLYGLSNTPDVDFVWRGPGGFTSFDSVVIAPGPGIYYLTVRDINDCSSIDSVEVSEDFSVATSTLSADSLRCQQDEASIMATTTPSESDHEWYFNNNPVGTGNRLEVKTAGTYTLVTRHPRSGCPDTSQVIVVRSSDTIQSLEMFVEDIDCQQSTGSIVIEAIYGSDGPYEFSLDGGPFSGSSVFNGVISGDHLVTAKDVYGCTYDTLVNISSELMYSMQLGPDFTLNKGESRVIPGMTDIPDSLINTIIWSPSLGLDCDDCLFPTAAPDQTTTYELIIEDANGCTYEDRITIEVILSEDIYIPNVFSPDGDGVNDRLIVQTASEAPLISFSVFDRWGEKIFDVKNGETNLRDFGWNGTFNGERAPQGVYVYQAHVRLNDRDVMIKGSVTLIY